MKLVGEMEQKKLATAERLDLALGKWEVVAPMPTARDGCAAASIADVIYVFGGRGVGQTLPAVERYDPRTGRWEQLPAMPQARCGCAAASAER
jgi:N-acetylneuraminic acid mutarotase